MERFWEGTRQPPGKSPQLPLDPAAPLRGVGAGWGVAEVGVEEEEEEWKEEGEKMGRSLWGKPLSCGGGFRLGLNRNREKCAKWCSRYIQNIQTRLSVRQQTLTLKLTLLGVHTSLSKIS